MSAFKTKRYNRIKAVLRENSDDPCVLCNRTKDDELNYGNIYTLHNISCHYFCVLLSSCAIQSGNDSEGLFGFLYSKIIEEVERGKKNRCSYCNKYGATLGCSLAQCKKQFHLPCGREHNAISIFHGNFKSFCEKHAPKQDIPNNILALARQRKKSLKLKSETNALENNGAVDLDDNTICVICCDNVPGYPNPQSFWPPCCARDVWFHRTCVQRMALSSGVHYLKCPLCNDKELFYKAVLKQGFYVPDRDAAWELEQNAFNDMYERPVKCDAAECKCDNGRSYDSEAGLWDIKLCLLCGSVGTHVGCLNEVKTNFTCDSCSSVTMPEDFEKLLESVRIQEQEVITRSYVGPPMPSRMSLRRTKGLSSRSDLVHSACTSRVLPENKSNTNEDLNEASTRLFNNSYLVRLKEDFNNLSIDDLNLLFKKMEERLTKPMPLRVKNELNATIHEMQNYIKLKSKEKHDERTIIGENKESEIKQDLIVENNNIIENVNIYNTEKEITIKSNIIDLTVTEKNNMAELKETNDLNEESSLNKMDVNFTEDSLILKDNLMITLMNRERKTTKRKHEKMKRESKKNKRRKNKYKIQLKQIIDTPKQHKTKLKFNISPKLIHETGLNLSPNKSVTKSVKKDKKRSYKKNASPDTNYKQTTLFNYFNCRS